MNNILITGGAGFIGRHVVRHFVERYPDYNIVNLDALTYAGSTAGLADLEARGNYTFVQGDICDAALVARIFAEHDIDGVIHLAAESHVDRSIGAPLIFAQTNVMGTLTLLEAARAHWSGNGHSDSAGASQQISTCRSESSDRRSNEGNGGNGHSGRNADGEIAGASQQISTCRSESGGGKKSAWEGKRFYQISTDEVYGALGAEGFFTEDSRYDPHSPYSASKAAADHFVRAYGDTYGMPVVISNCTNNYGPGQYPEKLIPLMISNIAARRPLPVYGDGSNVRDWIWVGDHVEAIDAVFHRGVAGETYIAGGGNELRNIDLVRMLVRLTDAALGRAEGESENLITFVTDRAGHDFRYAADISKIARELNWKPRVGFEEGLRRTVEWYVAQG